MHGKIGGGSCIRYDIFHRLDIWGFWSIEKVDFFEQLEVAPTSFFSKNSYIKLKTIYTYKNPQSALFFPTGKILSPLELCFPSQKYSRGLCFYSQFQLCSQFSNYVGLDSCK